MLIEERLIEERIEQGIEKLLSVISREAYETNLLRVKSTHEIGLDIMHTWFCLDEVPEPVDMVLCDMGFCPGVYSLLSKPVIQINGIDIQYQNRSPNLYSNWSQKVNLTIFHETAHALHHISNPDFWVETQRFIDENPESPESEGRYGFRELIAEMAAILCVEKDMASINSYVMSRYNPHAQSHIQELGSEDKVIDEIKLLSQCSYEEALEFPAVRRWVNRWTKKR